MKPKTILVPIDLSEHSKALIEYSVELAKKLNSKILILHAQPMAQIPQTITEYANASGLSYPTHISVEEFASIRKEKELILESIVEEIPALFTVSYETKIITGDPADVICDEAQNVLSDLIVMGTGGASGLDEVLIGTKGERVSRKAPCPVLVIPENCDYAPFENIYLAIDEDSLEHGAQLDFLLKIAKRFHSNIHIVYVTEQLEKEKSQLIMRKLNNSIQNHEFSFHMVTHEDTEKGIFQFIEDDGTSLLAIIFREHNFIERTFNPGLRKKLVFHTDKPLLILK